MLNYIEIKAQEDNILFKEEKCNSLAIGKIDSNYSNLITANNMLENFEAFNEKLSYQVTEIVIFATKFTIYACNFKMLRAFLF